MRLALISDLHSNLEALEAVLAHIDAQGVDSIGCLGDVVGYGPDPEACVDLVRARADFCLLGNHDEALFHGARDFNPHARVALEWTRARLAPRWYHGAARRLRWTWLQGLQPSHRLGPLAFHHASPRDPVREYVLSTDGMLNRGKLEDLFGRMEGPTFIGHTHHPGVFDADLRWTGLDGEESFRLPLDRSRRSLWNVGSVGQPRDGDSRACYALVEEDAVTWWRVPYDHRETARKILATGRLGEVLARRLAMGR